MEHGVPQGSVLGPCLWNTMHGELLRLKFPNQVEHIAFANEIAVVATEKHSNFLEEKLQ